jgi:hypothetical protein
MTTTTTRRSILERAGRLAAVGALALALAGGIRAHDADAATTRAVDCAALAIQILNTANQALAAEAAGNTVAAGNATKALERLVNIEAANC